MTTFIVNGKEREIEMRVNGIDISADFIGNTHHGMDSDDDGKYIATQEDYDWWVEFIDAYQAMEEQIAAYKEDHDPDEVDKVVQDAMAVDIADQPSSVQLALEQVYA